MRLRVRLTVGFLTVIILPIVLIGIAIYGLSAYQSVMIEKKYAVDSKANNILANPTQIFNVLTKEDYKEIKEVAVKNPEKMNDMKYLEDINNRLSAKYSFLLVRKGEEILYCNTGELDWLYNHLPKFGEYSIVEDAGLYIGGNKSVLIKQQDFYFDDGIEGSIFVVTDVNILVPQLKNFMIQMIFVAVSVMVLTGFVITYWIYRGIVKPLNTLRIATNRIKYGNLDFSIEQGGEDEIGQLCSDFEEMRARLKEYTEMQVRSELDSKELISNISHDLKTPITAIKGYVEGIMDGVADTPEKMDKYLKTIYTKANDMTVLIDELFLYSKIDTDTIPYNFRKIDLDSYFRDCIEDVGLDLESKNVDIGYFNYAPKGLYIVVDPEQLKRVINNIINNAVKYIGKKKGIINVRIMNKEEEVSIEIEDNGKGIAEKDIYLIFERFYRTDTSRNSAQGGSGLGLAISKKIIEEHGGSIYASSKEGTGTMICFTLKKYKEATQHE